ncbi:MAG TPA: hypothetical protein VK616_15835 [Flavitalea sp.]|nr:hypothetical protein [Flavitalea sp.]
MKKLCFGLVTAVAAVLSGYSNDAEERGLRALCQFKFQVFGESVKIEKVGVSIRDNIFSKLSKMPLFPFERKHCKSTDLRRNDFAYVATPSKG